jgi:ribosomal protein S18 acetylase RimI-like enzyme
MLEIRPLTALDGNLLRDLITGYTSDARYEVTKHETPEYTHIELRLVQLAQPFIKRYTHLDTEVVQQYTTLVARGYSLGAFADERCVGIALAEPQAWNLSLLAHELHVSREFQRQGIGRRLVEALVAHGLALGMRCIVCETQTTNVPSIRFYRAMGFTLDGVDLSLYSNDDREQGEIALFMKRYFDAKPGEPEPRLP